MARRILGPNGGKRGAIVGPMLLMGLVALLPVAVAQAVHDDNLFELGPGAPGGATNILGDGNAANGPDWADLFDANGDSTGNLFGGLAAAFLLDDTSQKGAMDRTTFSGARRLEQEQRPDLERRLCGAHTAADRVGVRHMALGLRQRPGQGDLVNSYMYATMPTTGDLADHLIIYGGLERLDESGDSHIDLEFLQNSVNIVDGAVSGRAAIPCNDPGLGSDSVRVQRHPPDRTT